MANIEKAIAAILQALVDIEASMASEGSKYYIHKSILEAYDAMNERSEKTKPAVSDKKLYAHFFRKGDLDFTVSGLSEEEIFAKAYNKNTKAIEQFIADEDIDPNGLTLEQKVHAWWDDPESGSYIEIEEE